MGQIEASLLKFFGEWINPYFSTYVLVIALIGIGVFFTVKTKFVQVRCFKQGMKQVFGNLTLNGKKHQSGMSSFQAFTAAVAAQVGTGNIVGACGAIMIGGPGAIFWMWIIAFLGMATIYAEAVVAQKTRIKNADGTITGGPVYYIRQAFPNAFGKFLAGFFAVSAIIALGFVGSMVQSNSIGEAIAGVTNNVVPTWTIGIVLAVIAGLVFIGGVSRLASVTEKLVPLMAVIYLLGGIVILCANIVKIPEAIGMIFKYAFNPNAIVGGGVGVALVAAISQGAKRGLFSNEAGMGSTPHAHAQANVKDPHDQGITAMIGVFFDTFVVLTMTALIVITTMYAGNGPLSTVGSASAFSKTTLVAQSVGRVFGGSNVANTVGGIFVAVCLLFFAFSTIVSWNMFGRVNFTYVFGNSKTSNLVYSAIAVAFTFLGTMFQNDLVWELTDFFNYLMVVPNVIALIALSDLAISSALQKHDGFISDKELDQ